MTTAIRITLTPELKMILEDLKKVYPALNDAELIKMAVSGFYSNSFKFNFSKIQDGEQEKQTPDSKITIKHNSQNDSYSISPTNKSKNTNARLSSLKFKQAFRGTSHTR